MGPKADQYDEDDADYEDEDDPDDADFDPDYGATSLCRGSKEAWDGEEWDDDVVDSELSIFDENDACYKKGKVQRGGKSGSNLKSAREPKSLAAHTRQRRGRTLFEEEEEEGGGEGNELSVEDLEDDSEEDFKSKRRKDAHVYRKNVGWSASVNVSRRNNELRTSGRSVRKVSYVESDESEDLDEGKKKKNLKIEVSDVSKEMDLDIIKQNSKVERIIADRLKKDGLGDVVPEYLVKWQGHSYAEATWERDIDIAFALDAIDYYKVSLHIIGT
ncbi:CHROMATIN REMODELING 5 isoform X1 [Olea europaea subsp. europaea]|uniref:CHROMATIN REMODELING 5 isoform X1 n=1 Tax=Olea europaea subsp. europaea TaxID=158383 RepID=A0A8S0VJY2_OLEEU|nr:CHROMATIN REMODELING 5 isoform X1 [Olea europaea subsp. europaea]